MRDAGRKRNSLLNLLTGVGGQGFLILLKFITRTVFIHTLGSSYLGINGLFSDILTMLSLTELGFDTAINYRLYKPLAEGDQKRVRILVKFYKTIYRVIGLVIFILGLCLIPFLPYLIRDYNSLEMLHINAALVFILYLFQSISSYLFFAYRSAVIKADQKEYILNISTIVVTIIGNILQIVTLYLFMNFILYTCILILTNIGINLVNAFIAKKMYPNIFIAEKDTINKEEVKNIFKDCAALFIYKVNAVVLNATDNLVISSFIGLKAVGIYSNYLMIYAALCRVLNRFYEACKASIGNLFATSNVEKKYFIFEFMNYMTFILYGTICIFIGVVMNELIVCWIGTNYLLPQPIAILLGIEVLFLGIRYNLGQIRNITGAFRQMWYRPIFGIIINIVVSIVLVQRIGISGILIGTIVANILTNFAMDPQIIHKYSFDNYRPVSYYYKKNILFMFILLTVGIADYWVCSWFFAGFGWLSVMCHTIICGISVPTVFVIAFFNKPERAYLFDSILFFLRKRKNVE